MYLRKHCRIICIVLTIIIIAMFIFSASAFAATDESKPSYISYLLSIPINGLANGIMWLEGETGFYTIEQLVFSDKKNGLDTADVFTQKEWDNVIMLWYRLMFAIATLGVVYQLVVTWIGYKTLAASINPRRVVNMQNILWNIILALLFMAYLPMLAKIMFQANSVFVSAIKNTLVRHGIYNTAIASISWDMIKNTNDPLLTSLIKLGFAGLVLILNFLYMTRKFFLGVLIIISPIVAWSILSSKKMPMVLMLSEIVSNGFMSLSHAIVLAFYASIVTYNSDGMFSTWWAKLFALSLLIPVSAFLRRLITGWLNLIGLDEEKFAGLSMLGVGSMMATGMILWNTLSKKDRSGYSPKPPQPSPRKNDDFGEPYKGPHPSGSSPRTAQIEGMPYGKRSGYDSDATADGGAGDISAAGSSLAAKPTESGSFETPSGPAAGEGITKTPDKSSVHFEVPSPEQKGYKKTGVERYHSNADGLPAHSGSREADIDSGTSTSNVKTPPVSAARSSETPIASEGASGGVDSGLDSGASKAEPAGKGSNAAPATRWPTLKKVISKGSYALNQGRNFGRVYGPRAAAYLARKSVWGLGVAGKAAVIATGIAAGTAFALPTGNAGTIREFQMIGAQLGMTTVNTAAKAGNMVGTGIKYGTEYIRQKRKNRNALNLDKPTLNS